MSTNCSLLTAAIPADHAPAVLESYDQAVELLSPGYLAKQTLHGHFAQRMGDLGCPRPQETDMRFMVMVKATKDSEAGVMPTQEEFAAMGAFNEELVRAGAMEAGEGLHPSSRGARVAFSGKTRRVIDGPFSEAKELVAGFWIWKCASLQEAVEWVKRCPNPMRSDSEIEIRQIFSAEDFGDALTPELREQEERLRKEVQSRAG